MTLNCKGARRGLSWIPRLQSSNHRCCNDPKSHSTPAPGLERDVSGELGGSNNFCIPFRSIKDRKNGQYVYLKYGG